MRMFNYRFCCGNPLQLTTIGAIKSDAIDCANRCIGRILFETSFMANNKNFKLEAEQIVRLIKPMGACFATDKITVEGELVYYMVREEPDDNMESGWHFFSGTEDQDYVDNPDNWALYDVNTIANYDKAIIPYLHYPMGSKLERIRGTEKFQIISE